MRITETAIDMINQIIRDCESCQSEDGRITYYYQAVGVYELASKLISETEENFGREFKLRDFWCELAEPELFRLTYLCVA